MKTQWGIIKKALNLCLIPAIVFGMSPNAFSAFESGSLDSRGRALNSNIAGPLACSNSVFSNEAQLVFVRRPEVSFTFSKLLTGLSDETNLGETMLTAAYPFTEEYCFGLGYMKRALSNIYAEETITLSGAVKLSDRFSLGAGLKQASLKYGVDSYTIMDPVFSKSSSKSAADIDLSLLVSINGKSGLVLSRSNMLNADLGLASEYKVDSANSAGVYFSESGYLCTTEFKEAAGDTSLSSGFEKGMMNDIIKLRSSIKLYCGYIKNINIGLGLNLAQMRIDYAFEFPLNSIDTMSGSHFLTTTMYFDDIFKKGSTVSKPKPPKRDLSSPVRTETGEAVVQTLPQEESDKFSYEPALSGAHHSKYDDGCNTQCAPEAPVIKAAKKSVPVVAQAATPGATPSAAPESGSEKINTGQSGRRFYKVKEGDTLPELSDKYYKDKSKWQKIYETNSDKVEKGYLKQGEVIEIPQ